MTHESRTDERLRVLLGEVAPSRVPAHVRSRLLTSLDQTDPRPRWLAVLTVPPMRYASEPAVGSPALRVAYLMVLATILVVLFAAGVAVGASLLSKPSPLAHCGRPSCPAGSLAQPRGWHTATLLDDGRVLVIGGAGPDEHEGPDAGLQPLDGSAATAELWDPTTQRFTLAGTLISERQFHSATLLTDGRVLVVGGRWGPVTRDSAEVWDPASAAFGPAGTLRGRSEHSATLLPDGRVLVIGGYGPGGTPEDAAEIFDPTTGAFGPAGTLADARASHTATLLRDGRVLVVGGYDARHTALSTAEIWDARTMGFEPTDALTDARAYHTATLLPDGRVLVIGGVVGFAPAWGRLATAEIWDPASGTFDPAGTLGDARASFRATLLPDGRVLVTGGDDDEDDGVAAAEIWDPVTGSFEWAGDLTEARGDHTATLLGDGRVLLVGGVDDDYETKRGSVELFDPSVSPPPPDDSPMQ